MYLLKVAGLILIGAAIGTANAQSPPRIDHFQNKLIDSSSFGYTYGYAPSIIEDQGVYHMFYCSTGDGIGFDTIRYSSSFDGRVWSTPTYALTTSDTVNERATCDPSVVRYDAGDGPYYYLFYSGNKPGYETVMLVARSASIAGPYAKLTDRGTWEVQPTDPKIIIFPKNSAPPGVYGAGQQTVVVKDGVLHSWYMDDTATYPPTAAYRIYHTSTTDPKNWPTAVQTNVQTLSVDVKYDAAQQQYVMYDVSGPHAPQASLVRRYSSDGVNWSSGSSFCSPACGVAWSHNIGVSGDREGHVVPGRVLVVFGAPYDLASGYNNDCAISGAPYCWGYWDLYGGMLNLGSAELWGWSWAGMASHHLLASGDYDGDGKTDRAIVDPISQRWYILSSLTGGVLDVPGYSWGWQWPAMGSNFELALGDYDGDGKTDRAFVDRSTSRWYVIASSTGQPLNLPTFASGWQWTGMTSSFELALADYDGDGKTDRAIVDRSTQRWYIISSATGGPMSAPAYQWAWQWPGMSASAKLAVADYDGDGKADRAIVEFGPSSSRWYVISTATGAPLQAPGFTWGWEWGGVTSNNFELVVADYDGDGKADRATVYRAESRWYVISTGTGQFLSEIPWGSQWLNMGAPEIIRGDFDGDFKADPATVDRSTSSFFVTQSSRRGFTQATMP